MTIPINSTASSTGMSERIIDVTRCAAAIVLLHVEAYLRRTDRIEIDGIGKIDNIRQRCRNRLAGEKDYTFGHVIFMLSTQNDLHAVHGAVIHQGNKQFFVSL